MKFEVTIERPDGSLAKFDSTFPTQEIAEDLLKSDIVLMNALFEEAYQGRKGRLVSVIEYVDAEIE